MKFNSDIDIDLGNRDDILQHIRHVPAAMRKNKSVSRHLTGIHVTEIPTDHLNNLCAIDYEQAAERGYIKLDLLNVNVYKHIRDEDHLKEMMKDPDWSLLTDRTVVERLLHIHSHYETMRRMPEPINSIPRLAMFLAVMRPGKRHLVGKTWAEVAKTVWEKEDNGGFTFKKAHAIAYAHLIVVNLNLFVEMPDQFPSLA
jgi:uncharacterized protein (DUF2342 family)